MESQSEMRGVIRFCMLKAVPQQNSSIFPSGTLSIKSTAIFFSLAVAPRPQQIINYKLTQKTQFTGRHKNLRMGNVVRGPLIFIQSIRKRTEIKLLK